jgi:hypothetical protein
MERASSVDRKNLPIQIPLNSVPSCIIKDPDPPRSRPLPVLYAS